MKPRLYTLPGGSVTNFHVYVLEWTTNAISWYVDGLRYETQTNWSDSAGTLSDALQPAVLHHHESRRRRKLPGQSVHQLHQRHTPLFPAKCCVDYVRLYNLTAPLQLTAGSVGGKLSLTWPTNIVCHLESATNLPRRRVGPTCPDANPPFLPRPLFPPPHFTAWSSP